jgi:aldehyde dehydrogenase (NAD+)
MSESLPFEHSNEFYIDGAWITPSSDAMIKVISSSTEELFVSVAEAQEADVNRAVSAARGAFDKGPWPRMSHAERAVYLRRIGIELDLQAEQAARIWTTESGVLYSSAKLRTQVLSEVYTHYAGLAETFPFQERHVPQAGNVGLLVREPVGVVAAIIPWNGPFALTAAKCAPALLAGCTIVLKASPEAPGAAYLMALACERAGLPRGVLNVVTADREVSELLIRHPGVDKITFTGSTAAGRRIAAACGDRIARYTLELGGKSPAVILDDFDIGAAAEAIASRAVFLTGQVCASLSRVIVARERHDDMVEALSSNFCKLKIGNPFDPSMDMGPLATQRQRDRVEAYISQGMSEGAMLACGGRRPAHTTRGFYIEPTVFGRVDNQSTIGREEIFGPVLCVIPAEDETDAIRIANDTPYGLNASVFTNDLDRAYAAARELRCGTVGHNSYRADFRIAFGGFKQSGIGREGGTEGLLPYLEMKTLILEGLPASAGRVVDIRS